MATLLEQQIKAAERALKAEKTAEEVRVKARAQAIRARKALQASRLKMRDMIGDTILDAYDSGNIRPGEMAAISALLARRKDKPADWDLLKDWMPPAKVGKVDPLEDAAE